MPASPQLLTSGMDVFFDTTTCHALLRDLLKSFIEASAAAFGPASKVWRGMLATQGQPPLDGLVSSCSVAEGTMDLSARLLVGF